MNQRPRVVLVDLHARADAFTADDGFLRLSAALSAQGFEAVVVQGVGVDLADPATREPLARAVAQGAVALVVARAWSEPMVAALRSLAPPGAALVRYVGTGTRAALDDRFDHVVDHEGLVTLLAGKAPRAAEFKPRTASELRRLKLVEPGPEPASTVELHTAGASRPRPTLSGPAHGCPYLKDARTSPIYAGLAIDAAHVQMKGCTFCLDNTGGYAAPTEAEVLAAWLRGLRAARASDPGVREVLLTDERPHPFLPAFFRAVHDDPSLWGVELLMKSRVDWLLEHADGALVEACEIAARSGSVLHVYLVGFENFDAFHLELFNKGQTADDNRRAIDKLRELEARFPSSFEFRRHRAHGVVLFTPWTTPDALLENARWMRAVRFDELRSEAVLTRLRLYPRTPLFHLAARDGLLTASFEASRGDRAEEQGYDASAPWRFRDDRMEAIFRVASSLGRGGRHAPDPEALEFAVGSLELHPGLAQRPDVAHLPLLQALSAWATPAAELTRSLGHRLAPFDPEADAVRLGLKPACLKEQVPAAEVEPLGRAYEALGLVTREVSRYAFDARRGDHLPGDAMSIVAVARDEATLASLVEKQRALRNARDPRLVAEVGALMGYPACCADAFARREGQGDNLDNERRPFVEHPDAPLHPLLSRLGTLRLVSHHLCSPSCVASADRAGALLEALRRIDPDKVTTLERGLASPVLFIDYRRRARLDGEWQADRFVVASAVSLEDDPAFTRALEGARWLTLDPRGVSVHTDHGTRRIDGAHPLLVVPGKPLAPAALAALAPPPGAPAGAGRAANPREGAGPRRMHPVPALPAMLKPGLRVREFRLAQLLATPDGHALVLARPGEAATVHLRPVDLAREGDLEVGPWAVAIEPSQGLSPLARAAVGLVLRALEGRDAAGP